MSNNKTPALVYALWAAVMAIFMLVIGVHFHPAWPTYAVGGVIWCGGIGYMVWQIVNDGDTTMTPYYIQTLGALVFGIMAAAS